MYLQLGVEGLSALTPNDWALLVLGAIFGQTTLVLKTIRDWWRGRRRRKAARKDLRSSLVDEIVFSGGQLWSGATSIYSIGATNSGNAPDRGYSLPWNVAKLTSAPSATYDTAVASGDLSLLNRAEARAVHQYFHQVNAVREATKQRSIQPDIDQEEADTVQLPCLTALDRGNSALDELLANLNRTKVDLLPDKYLDTPPITEDGVPTNRGIHWILVGSEAEQRYRDYLPAVGDDAPISTIIGGEQRRQQAEYKYQAEECLEASSEEATSQEPG